MIWVAKNLYFFNCLLDGAHTIIQYRLFFKFYSAIRKIDIKYAFQTPAFLYLSLSEKPCSMTASDGISSLP